MYSLVLTNLSFLLLSKLVISTIVQPRLIASSASISVPVFTYGYYSQVYPNGEVTTSIGTITRNVPSTGALSPSSTRSVSLSGTLAAGVGLGSGPGGSNSDTGPVDTTQEEAFIESMCQPVNKTNEPDMSFPCNKILLYETPCIYGQSYAELVQNSRNGSVIAPNHGPKDQQSCFCAADGLGPQFWQNSVE